MFQGHMPSPPHESDVRKARHEITETATDMFGRVQLETAARKDIEPHPIVPDELPSTSNNVEGFDCIDELGRQGVLRREVSVKKAESRTWNADGDTVCYESLHRASPRLVSAFLQRNRA